MSYPHISSDCGDYHDLVRDFGGSRPPIVVLCGSTRFKAAFEEAEQDESLAGRIVLTVGLFAHADHGGHAEVTLGEDVKQGLDDLHKRKIDLADEVLVVSDASGYYGASTKSEIEYARRIGKPIRYWRAAS